MAEPSSIFTDRTKQYIERVAPWAKEAADRLNIPAAAILGAVANEYDTRFNPDLAFGLRGGAAQAFADWWSAGSSHDEISEDFGDRESGKSAASKFWHPAKIDIGPGNIRVETAIDLLKDYLVSHEADGQDPLQLRQYENDYGKLANDLLDFDQPKATMAFAGLMVAKADDFFKGKNAAAWDRLSDDEKDALRVTYYKLGPKALSKNIDPKIAETERAGADFVFNPYGDGGAQHLKNVEAIKQAIDRGLSGVDHGGRPAPGIHGLNGHGVDRTIKTAANGDLQDVDTAEAEPPETRTFAKSIYLSPADILRLKKAVMTEWDQRDDEDEARGVLDVILNRYVSGHFGSDLREILNKNAQFTAINSDRSRKVGQYDVDQLSVSDPRFAKVSND